MKLKNDDVEWVVNDMGELGVKIKDQFFFLYKGCSYQGGEKWRHVFKREFGECCHAWTTLEIYKYGDVKTNGREIRLPETYVGHYKEDLNEWKDLPPDENE